MSTTLIADEFRGARRVRLVFSGALASGAFTSTSLYAVADADSSGPSPINVEAVFAISSNPNAVELSVSCDFVGGAHYTITCTSVPCADASHFTGSVQDRVALPVRAPVNAEPETSDVDLVLYGRDLAWNGQDFVQGPGGDLATVTGQPNWQAAVTRRELSAGITWDPAYGAQANEYVDAPDIFQRPLAGILLAQARLDDRTAQASIEVAQDPNDADSWIFLMSLQGRDGLQPITVTIPSPSRL